MVAGRSEAALPCLSFHYITLLPLSTGSSYILRYPSVITPSHHTLLPIHCRRYFANKRNPQASLSTHLRHTTNYNFIHRTPPTEQQRITSTSQQYFYNQRVCCDHQFTDRCSECESPTRPRSSPLRLVPQALRRVPTPSSPTCTWHSTESHYAPARSLFSLYSTRSQVLRAGYVQCHTHSFCTGHGNLR